MKRIKLLPAEVYSRIAAGEVIERPSSVIRELIDNSVDAGAREITVRVENAGLKKITVADDGGGILKDDLPLAFSMHATSKIESVDDLARLFTMGFRGEALHSIQTVSKITITSNTDASGKSPGYRISNYGDKPLIPSPVAFNRGTKVEVEEIFFNLPARKKFLKSEISEWNSIKKTVAAKALAMPDISFKMYNGNDLAFSTKGNGNFPDAFFDIYRNENRFEILKYEKKTGANLEIVLYYSESDVFFQNRNYQNIYVNSRPVTVSFFYAAIDSGMRSLVSPGRFPLAFVYVGVNPGFIDVNIHPAKKEIKFLNQNEIFTAIQSCIMEAFSMNINRNMAGIADSGMDSFGENPGQNEIKFYHRENQKEYFEDYYNDVVVKNEERIVPDRPGRDYTILGVAFDTYIIVQEKGRVLFIDQHAAAEAILFIYKKEKLQKNNESEKLLIPIVVELDNYDEDTEANIGLLNSNKFSMERSEGSSIVIREIPAILLKRKNYDIAVEIIKSFLEDHHPSGKADILSGILIEASCREAVKKGDKLTLVETAEIVDEYFRLGITNCPHGRPSHFEVTHESLQKIFQRKK